MKLLLLFLFFACTQAPIVEDVNSVNIVQDSERAIVIESSGDEVAMSDNIEEETEKKVKISLTLYSSIYHSLAAIELLKELDKNSIELFQVSSQGFGNLIFGLYGKYHSVGKVEWSLFKLLKQLNPYRPYSKKWMDIVNDFIDEEFKDERLEELRPKLIIPVLAEHSKVLYMDKGKAKTWIKNSLNLERKDQFYLKPQLYHFGLDRFLPDLNIAVSFIANTPKVSKMNGYSYGLITSHLGVILNSSDELNLLRTDIQWSMDELMAVSEISQAYRDEILKFIEELKKKIKNWQEEGSSGFSF